jgi:O-acetyl-ADP-ribose deacetylase (regulator of RNase III)
MPSSITFIKSDATNPQTPGNKIIVHICNDIGGWGKGFVMALSRRWKQPEEEYRLWYTSKDHFELGAVQFVQVNPDTWVANLIGQRDIKRSQDNVPPIRYEAVATGLLKVANFAKETNATVHMPRIGCGLAGGTWDKMEPIIQVTLVDQGIPVTVYDFE